MLVLTSWAGHLLHLRFDFINYERGYYLTYLLDHFSSSRGYKNSEPICKGRISVDTLTAVMLRAAPTYAPPTLSAVPCS